MTKDSSSPEPAMRSPFECDPAAARRAFRRAARERFDFELFRESAKRLLGRLEFMNIEPARILDCGCGYGRDLGALRGRYPRARVVGLDSAWEALRAGRKSRPLPQRVRSFFASDAISHLCADLSSLPFADSAIGLIWSNLALAWAQDLPGAFREWHRVLAPGGLVIFSAYGPDTLRELRQAFAVADAGEHVHPFLDMHDLGDMLVAAGFSAPVLDVDRIRLTYSGVEGLLRDLKLSGQVNTLRGRARGMLGRGRWQAMLDAYERVRSDGRIPASVELVFGHAWKGSVGTARTAGRSEWTPVRIQANPPRGGPRERS